ncbi:hypothetical protein B4U80_10266, partial [Leptotrombidium deliense]
IEDVTTITTSSAENNPCSKLHCGNGRQCVIENEQATCVCVKECPENKDKRRMVCSNTNQTWESDCHIYRHRCLCLADCKPIDKHLHINYYGECHQIPDCEESVIKDFPRRMRDWLYRIMQKKHVYNKTEVLSNTDHLSSDWILAVIWKYCDLDTHPSDRFVSRHELFPLRAPLLSMEPCISRFLDDCDSNDDHKITLIEWGKCLGAPEEIGIRRCIRVRLQKKRVKRENTFRRELDYKCKQFNDIHAHDDMDNEVP